MKMQNKTFRILSLDGGGIRGIITAVILAEIEKKILKKEVTILDYFDMIAATSSGSMIAAGLILGKTASQVFSEYLSKAQVMFPKESSAIVSLERWIGTNIFGSSFGIFKPRYTGKHLSNVLVNQFGEDWNLKDLNRKLMIFGYETTNHLPIIFSNLMVENEYLTPYWIEIKDICLWEAVACSSSCPALFPAYQLNNNKKVLSVVDGSIGAFNPAIHAIATAINLGYHPSNIQVISIGSGDPNKFIPLIDAQKWGMLQWSSRLFNLLTFGAYEFNNYASCKLSQSYLRFQPKLKVGYKQNDVSSYYDDASDKNIQNLIKVAEEYIKLDNTQLMLKNI